MVNFSKLSFCNHLLCDSCLRIIDGADLDCQLLTVLFLCIIKNLGICIARCHRLLRIARIARSHNCCSYRGVQIIVHAYLYFIDVISLQHLTEICVQIFFCDAVFFAESLQTFRDNLGSGYNLEVISAFFQILDNCHMSVRNHAASDNGDSHLFH